MEQDEQVEEVIDPSVYPDVTLSVRLGENGYSIDSFKEGKAKLRIARTLNEMLDEVKNHFEDKIRGI